jgi:hypothetical protein
VKPTFPSGPRPDSGSGSRVKTGRAAARAAKLTGALAAAGVFGVLALVARASHGGSVAHGKAAPAPLSAPRSFVQALDGGLSPGDIGPASGPPQAQSGGS